MERLTYRDNEGWYVNGENGERLQGPHVDMLAAYLKSGLEPCDYALVRSSLEKEKKAQADLQVAINALGRLGSELSEYNALGSLDHLKELVQAENDGRLVVLPCKKGTRVYKVISNYETYTGCDCCLNKYGFETSCAYWDEKEEACNNFTGQIEKGLRYGIVSKRFTLDMLNDFGKTVFLTREEAEAALAEKGEKA